MTTLIWCDGLEYGVNPTTSGTGLWDEVGGSPTASTTQKHSGSYSLKINPSAGVSYTGRYYTAGIMVRVVYVYFVTLPDALVDIFGCYGADGEFNAITFDDSDNKLYAASASGGTPVAGPVVTTGVWYRIDAKFVFNSTTHTIDWKVDGAAQTQWSWAGRTNENIIAYYQGVSGTCTTEFYLDDMAVSVTSGDFPIGPGSVYGISSTADGTHNAGTNVIERQDGQDIGVVTAYDLLNSVPIGNTTAYVRQAANGTGNYAEVQMADINTNIKTVVGAHAVMAYYSETTSSNDGEARVRDGAGAETVIYNGDMSESSVFYKSVQVSTPAAGWSPTTVNGLLIRCGYSSDASPDPYFVDFMIQVFISGADIPLDALTLASSLQDLTVGKGAVAVVLDSLTLASSIPDITVIAASGAVTVNLDALTLASSIPSITIGKGSVSITLDAQVLASTLNDLAVGKGAISVSLDALTLAGSVQDLTIGKGAVSTTLDALELASSIPALALLKGGVNVQLDGLTLASTLESLDVIAGGVSVILDALILASSIPALSTVKGAITVTLDALTLASTLPDITVHNVSGAVTVALQAQTLASSIPALAVGVGGITVVLDPLTLAGSTPALTVGKGGVVITLDTQQLSASLPDLTVEAGSVTAMLSALTLASSIPDLDVEPGEVTVLLDDLILAGSMPALMVTPGGVIVPLDAMVLSSSLPVIAIVAPGAGTPPCRFMDVGLVRRTQQDPARMRLYELDEAGIARQVLDEGMLRLFGMDKAELVRSQQDQGVGCEQ